MQFVGMNGYVNEQSQGFLEVKCVAWKFGKLESQVVCKSYKLEPRDESQHPSMNAASYIHRNPV